MAEPVPPGTLDVLNLSNELTKVVDWHQLGLQLGLPNSELSKVEADHPTTERRKTETLDLWLRRTPNASWGDVVTALRRMGENRVAENIAARIATKIEVVSGVDDSPLDERDLLDILSTTIEVAARWKHIGDTFRLSPGTLETIREEHSDAETRLREVILRWLRRSGYDYRQYGPPTWRWVVEAVGSPAGGNNPELARRIAAQHSRAYTPPVAPREESVPPPVAPHEESVPPPRAGFAVIERSDLDIGDNLGGEVYKCVWKSRRLTVAVKRLTGKLEEGEASKLGSLRHRNIILFHGVVMQAPDYWMVTEYAENGSLFDFLHQNQFNLERNLKWAKEIAQGLHYLHYEAPKSIIHGDLKSSNVLLTSAWTVKVHVNCLSVYGICDFGSARKYCHTTNKTILGTYPWTAPEVHKKKASISCDIFSYGVVLWELITHQKPFDGIEGVAVAMKIMDKERPPIPDGCPPYLAGLMKECWQHDPKQRPKSSDILEVLHRRNAAFSSNTPVAPVPTPETTALQASKFDPSPLESEDLLEATDLLEVTDYLIDLEKTDLYNLGLVLGLSQRRVKAMKDSETFLEDVIAAWLRKEDQVIKMGEPSWTVLVFALRHPRVEQTGIAQTIAKDKGSLLQF